MILVNLTCGRNPWKQACPSDETFRAYLANPDFLRSILPISKHTNSILKRIFAINSAARISLAELREEIKRVGTFVMTEQELSGASKATKEAARSFAGESAVGSSVEEDIVMDTPASPPPSPWSTTAALDESPRQVPSRRASNPPSSSFRPVERPLEPLTPPTTPRRLNRPPPLESTSLASGFSSGSNGSMSPCGSGSSDTLASYDTSAQTPVILSTPPQSSRVVFGQLSTPSTPTPRRTKAAVFPPPHASSHSAVPTLLASPTRPNTRARPARPARSLARKRKESLDSSSSSSGTSSQPATPSALDFRHPAASSIDYRLATSQVRIASDEVEEMEFKMMEDPLMSTTTPTTGGKGCTAYYPLFSDWSDVAKEQHSFYNVALPTPPSPTHHTRSHANAEGRRVAL